VSPVNEVFNSVDPDLREALRHLTQNYSGRNVRGQVDEVAHLRKRFSHSIRPVVLVEDAHPGPGQFNCFMHALDMAPPPGAVAKLMERFDHVYPGSEFVRLLVERRFLKATSEAREGDLLVYFSEKMPKHAGRIRGELVVSKWGLGHVWSHGVFELPSSYGNDVRTFKAVDGRLAAKWFVAYATALLGPDIIRQVIGLDA
jgi:hypothetical protein